MEKKEEVICDFTTGICGPADASDGVVEFVDVTATKEKDEEREEE